MTPARFSAIAAFAAAVIATSVVLLTSTLLRGVRIDLSQEQRDSLSTAGREAARALDEPIAISLFVTRRMESEDQSLRSAVAQVRESLAALERESAGRVRVTELDPDRSEVAQAMADRARMEPFRLTADGPAYYFGLELVDSVDQRRRIARFARDADANVESAIVALLTAVQGRGRPRVGLITSIAVDLDRARDPQASGQPKVFADLVERADVDLLPRDFTGLPDDLDVLAILHPWALDPQQMYAVDQFLMTKGVLFIALDPAYLAANVSGFDPLRAPTPSASSASLDALLGPLGVTVEPTVVLDQQTALMVETGGLDGAPRRARQPLYFQAPAEWFSADDALMSSLKRGIVLGAAGSVRARVTPGIVVSTLFQTSDRISRVDALVALANPTPEQMAAAPLTSGPAALAVRITGAASSAFGEARPAGVVAADASIHRARSDRDINVIVVADADYLQDRYYIGDPGAPDAEPALMDNSAFTLDAIESLSIPTALQPTGARADGVRQITVIEKMRSDIAAEDARLAMRLRATLEEKEAEMARLEEVSGADSAMLARVTEDVAQTRAQIRAIERRLRAPLDALIAWVTALNILALPVLLLVGGGFVAWRRRRAL